VIGAAAVVPDLLLHIFPLDLQRGDDRAWIRSLLAVGFIFTIHFFNAHLRLEKFPVDDVIFTGSCRKKNSSMSAAWNTPGCWRRESWRRSRCRRLRLAAKNAIVIGVLAMAVGTTLVR